MQIFADAMIINGKIYTMEHENEHYSTIAIKDGKIMKLGHSRDLDNLKGSETHIIDAKKRAVLPAFIESHGHPIDLGKKLFEVDCSPKATPNVKAVLAAVEEEVKMKEKGEWIVGGGWDENLMEESCFASIEELDQAAPNNPVFMLRTCVHNAMVNTKALEKTGITKDSPDPNGGAFGRDEAGELTGYVMEDAMSLFKTPEYTIDDLKKAWKCAEETLLSWGITSINDMSTGKDEFKAYQQLQKADELKIKVRMWLWGRTQMNREGIQDEIVNLGIESGFGNDQLNVQGIKYMIDGSVGGKTAAVAEAYESNPENYGLVYLDQAELNERFKIAVQNNLRISVHAIGETAIEMAIQGFEYADVQQYPHLGRHRIEHAILPTLDHLERMRMLNLVAASSIGFLYNIGDGYVNNLGLERVSRGFPHQKFKEMEIAAPGNSDLPVTTGNPLLGIYTAVTRKTSNGRKTDLSESLSVYDAIRAYTYDAAYSTYDEEMMGTLAPDKQADLIILEDNPFDIDYENLKEIKVDHTFVAGVEKYKRIGYSQW